MKYVLALLMSILAVAQAQACRCEWQGPFSWVAQDADLVVLARFGEQQTGNWRDVSVIDTLSGKNYDESLRLWGKFKDYCRVNIDTFPTNSRWVLALSRIDQVPAGGFDPDTPGVSYGRKGDYAMSQCGAYWLQEQDGKVTGNLTTMGEWEWNPPMQPVPLAVVKDFLNGNADYVDIIEHSNEITSPEELIRRSRRAIGIFTP